MSYLPRSAPGSRLDAVVVVFARMEPGTDPRAVAVARSAVCQQKDMSGKMAQHGLMVQAALSKVDSLYGLVGAL